MKSSKPDGDAPSPEKRRDGASPSLPHERDESAGVTGGVASEAIEQAHRDVQRGLQDTDRGPVADRAYRKLKDGA